MLRQVLAGPTGRWASVFVAWFVLCGAAQAAVTVTEKTITEATPGYEIDFKYPQTGVASVDADILAWVNDQANEFRSYGDTPEEGMPGPYSAELNYEVARNDDRMLAITLLFSHYTGGAHPNSNSYAFNYVMPSATRVYLADLVGNDGLKRVSELAIADLIKQMGGPADDVPEDTIRKGAEPFAQNFATFVMGRDELAVYFDPYQVAAYAMGAQEVHIPLSELAGVLRPDPLAPLPSFDCAKAGTPIEKAICSDRVLARLDRDVADFYGWRLSWASNDDEKVKLKEAQRSFVVARDTACAAASGETLTTCLTAQYTGRLTKMRTMTEP